MSIRVLLRDHPHRAVALATDNHVLTFQHNVTEADDYRHTAPHSQNGSTASQLQCMVEFSPAATADLSDFRSLTSLAIHGTLGLVSIGGDAFLCVVNGANKVASVKPGEFVQQITSVDFHCINRADHDYLIEGQVNRYPTENLDEDGYDLRHGQAALEHPCLALKKLLSGGSFYYSADFDLTRRLQDRPPESHSIALDSLDRGFLWNAFMIQPLVNFRSRLSETERSALDESRILTSAIRGFAMTLTVPAASAPISTQFSGMPSTLTLISRLSCKRAGTRFNARGIDDDGNVANFVETETVFCTPTGLAFSYVQIRGSVPVFWEQTAGFTPGQQKINLTRSAEATQPAFDKHYAGLESIYGAVHNVNLLGRDKTGEYDLTERYRYHVGQSPLNARDKGIGMADAAHGLLRHTDYDFHAETRGQGYDAARSIRHWLQDSADSFVYYLSDEIEEEPRSGATKQELIIRRQVPILQQEGTFRTNCLDCLDRTNVVQTIISQMALEEFIRHRSERRSSADFWLRHSTLWADNGDALSKIYAGTGALKSSFTRSGKMSLAGALADVRKSATRLYINNFEDKGRQITIDMLLGRLMGQNPVHLFDPINDHVQAEMARRTPEYTSTKTISIVCCTFNVNGKQKGIVEDLSPWLCPSTEQDTRPEIVAVGFQEIVELNPQQIMSTDPGPRLAWEHAIKDTLNRVSRHAGDEDYVLLRGGQLVGTSLSVFVKASILPFIKNVEGSLKKTGMSGMAGNKGAVAIRMDLENTSLCLVTAHLAAGFANYEERNQDFRTISHGLHFQRNRTIEDHDAIIWLGDFNYRIGMSNERTRPLIKAGDLETLYENDQLHLQMMHGRTFPHYSEARITFPPTYKYDNGTEMYDSSDKARIPAWCDRVLFKGECLRQTDYFTAPLMFSDHRPVYAVFQGSISVVDERAKQAISASLYQKRRKALANGSAGPTSPSEDEELQDYEAVEPGLPAASSDKRKWWLDGGQPAKSTVVPPGDGLVPNPKRAPNPFTPTTDPDWIKVDRPALKTKPSAPPSRRIPARANSSQSVSSNTTLARSMTPATNGEGTSTARKLPVQEKAPPLPSRSATVDARENEEATKLQKASSSKPAPPVPKKPTLLKSDSSSTIMSASGNPLPARNRQRDSPSPAPATGDAMDRSQPTPPPARRSTLVKSGPPAPLPPRQRIPSSSSPLSSSRPRSLADTGRRPSDGMHRSPAAGSGAQRSSARIPARTASGSTMAPSGNGAVAADKEKSSKVGNIMDEKDGDLDGWVPLDPM